MCLLIQRWRVLALALGLLATVQIADAEPVQECVRSDVAVYLDAIRVTNCLHGYAVNALPMASGTVVVAGSVTLENVSSNELIVELGEDFFRGRVIRLYCGEGMVSRGIVVAPPHDPSFIPVELVEYRFKRGEVRRFDFKLADVLERQVKDGAVCTAFMSHRVPFRYPGEAKGSAFANRLADERRAKRFPSKSEFEDLQIR